jgi:hypothetical protein
MKLFLLFILGLLIFFVSCKKDSSGSNSGLSVTWNGNLVPYAPIPVSKSVTKKVFAHFLPWFETPVTSSNDTWGEHWTLNGGNPPATIGSHYYPLNTLYYSNGAYVPGPYGTSDTTVIDYQLLLMKLSGIDGIFIDWPGTTSYADYLKNVANSNAVIARLTSVGLKYAIVYEDQNLQYASSTQAGQITQAQTDMEYIQDNYFTDVSSTYETYNGKPVLLDFGPFGPLQSSSDWDTIFSVMTTPPAFFPYEGSANKGGKNVAGEFAWVQQSNLDNLNSFYNNNSTEEKISGVYPGFNSFYTPGPGVPTWIISSTDGNTTTFDTTLSLALQQPGNYIQLITWNDYGEGTMIEPTTQYQYSFLTTLQQRLQVQSLSLSDLQAVAKLYTARRNNILPTYNQDGLNELNQVFYYMVSLKMDSAKALLQKDF